MCKESRLHKIAETTLKRVVYVEKKSGMPGYFDVPHVDVPRIKLKVFKANGKINLQR